MQDVSAEFHPRARQLVRSGWPLFALVGAIAVCIWALVNGWPEPVTSRGLNQHRANVTLPRPNGEQIIEQAFRPKHNGLTSIEIIFARNDFPLNEDTGALTLSLLREGVTLAEETLLTRNITHNQFYTLAFDPIHDSAELPLTLRLSAIENEAVTVWGYDLDAIASGAVDVSDPSATITAKDLRIVAQYRLTPSGAWDVLQAQLRQYDRALLLTPLLILMPGALIWQLLRVLLRRRLSSGDHATDLAIALSLGVAAWPIVWFWVTLIGGRFGRMSLLIILTIGYIATVGLGVYAQSRPTTEHRTATTRYLSPWPYVLLLTAFIVRMLAVRDLAFPAWVDSTRHALMTAVMTDSGQFLRTYAPYLPADVGPYHYGYHTIAAGLRLLNAGSLNDVLLVTGQIIGALVPFTIYAGAFLLTRRRSAALVAGFLVAFPFYFPGYYVSWGRLTQQTGMLLMPLLVAVTFQLTTRRKAQASLPTALAIILAALLSAGLFFIHFRVFLVFLPLAILMWLPAIWRAPWQLPLAGLWGGLLVAPRAWELVQGTRGATIVRNGSTYNAFPTGYLTVGWEREILAVVMVSLALALFVYIARWRWLRWAVAAGTLAYIGAMEWLDSAEFLIPIPWVTTGIAITLTGLTISNWRQNRYAWTLSIMLWLAFAPLADTAQQTWLLLPLALFVMWLAPQLAPHDDALADGQRPWHAQIIALAVWVGVLFATLLGNRIGLPETWVINLNSMYITLFLPFALVIGIASAAVWQWLRQQHWLTQALSYGLAGMLFATLAIFGAHNQVTILNQATVLAESPDLPAMQWIADKTPTNAKFAVSSWKWLGETWAAQDGGAWILPLTGRAVTTPPADYIYERALIEAVSGFNDSAEKITNWSSDEAIDLLYAHAVTHVYVGARGGYIKPDQLNRHPNTTLVYAEDGVFIFALSPR